MALLKSIFKKERELIREFEDFRVEKVYWLLGAHYEATSEKRNMVIRYGSDTFIDGLSMVFDIIHIVRERNMDYAGHSKEYYRKMLAEERMLRLEHRGNLTWEDAKNMEFTLEHSEPLRSV